MKYFQTISIKQNIYLLFPLSWICRPHEQDSAFGQSCQRRREGFYGFIGSGGSVVQWHPGHQIGFAYVPSLLKPYDVAVRGAALQVNERAKYTYV